MRDNPNNFGIVYVLTNPSMPGLVKIGMTTRDNLDTRMRELYGTGVPVPFECAYACKVKTSDCTKIEKALHTAFAPNRINANREFFQIKTEQAKAILELFNKEDITQEITEEIDNDLTSEDKSASAKINSSRRPPLNYFEMGMKKGDILVFTKNPNITIEIIDEKKVLYQEQIYSLTGITKKLLDISHAIQPTGYWSYDNKNLRDIYDETYTLEE
ncbi:GIY-YIG nuclease family protein [uncultured Bacteroides sp.]|uniref:GIY-YIG nuclease family protein n=1 Tax=uncultured Bacteroides sp. TaxID=162156 RepID=UPI00266FE762|nr:GIY-YIG nuclease family protein [uncultured Bacteroides sp.]